MAYKQILDKGTKNERIKVMYETASNGRSMRKRKSKTFPPGTPQKIIDRFVREVEQEKDEGVYIDSEKRTFAEFGDEYMDKYVKYISPSTLEGYKYIYFAKQYGLRDYFGNVKLSKVTTELVQDYINFLTEKGVGAKTVKNRVMLLHVIYSKAMKLNYVKRGYNPIEDVEMPKVKRKKIEAYSADEIKQILELADKDGSENLRLIMYIMLGTGIRKGELCGLTHESVNLEKKELYVNVNVIDCKGKIFVKEPKTSAGVRTISIPDTVATVIKEAMTNYKKRKLQDIDFVDSKHILVKKNGEPLYPDSVYNIYRNFMKAHPEIRYLSMHKLRHSYASINLANNVDIKTLQESLGHSTASMTLDTYGHGYSQNKVIQAKLLDETIFANKKII